ncbi:hypothetical protein MT325_m505R [Paramecium bursaria chlorella virus MT325]|uniref:Uncharacterized protein m505R n=1 Tax=Paramecium bursaria Chlorella virus MT325 TaxID=346932 RepID=A7IUN5_PBCVM|nr:hypothetical protein MT325_m505R [Paramecium bursaria chlorella virus MT325]
MYTFQNNHRFSLTFLRFWCIESAKRICEDIHGFVISAAQHRAESGSIQEHCLTSEALFLALHQKVCEGKTQCYNYEYLPDLHFSNQIFF